MTIAQIYEKAKRQLDKGIITIGEFSEIVDREYQEPSKLIPVSERLPENSKEVLTCSNGRFIEIQSLENPYDAYWENQSGDWTDFDEVIAWMPLPEPYKEKEE